MFVLWTKYLIEGQYILFIEKTIKMLEKKYRHFCMKYYEYIDCKLEKKNKISFNINLCETNDKIDTFYYTEINDIDPILDIYVLVLEKDDEKYTYSCTLEISNNRRELTEIAKKFFYKESLDNSIADINKMLSQLEKNDIYEIPEVRKYVSVIMLTEWTPSF